MRTLDDQIVGGTEKEHSERDILIEEAIMGIGKNQVQGKFPRIYKDEPN